MAEAFDERRSGEDRRQAEQTPTEEHRSHRDRRQFPVVADGDPTEEEVRVHRAIDRYKRERGLKRISMADLMDVLEELGYRKAGPA